MLNNGIILQKDQKYCVHSTLNICFPGVSSEALMIATKQYCALSNGSACNSKSYDPSYVLLVMGISKDDVEDSVRISFGAGVDVKVCHEDFHMLLDVVKSMQ